MLTEDSLALSMPTMERAEVARIAREAFGLSLASEAAITDLPGEYDANFKVRDEDGASWVLKVMHPARDEAWIDLQCAALTHLARTAPTLNLPRVRKTRTGERFARVDSRLVWMLSYIEGTPLAEVRPQSDEMLLGLGRYLGGLSRGLEGFTHGASERDFKWNLIGARWVSGALAHHSDPARRRLVEAAIGAFEAQVVPRMPTLRRSVIHGDANDYNVLIESHGQGPRGVASVIDFGDMHLGLTVGEVAIAATYALLGRKDPLAAAAVVVRGYHETYPLNDHEIAAIFPLIQARLAVSVTNSAIRHAIKPDDPYLTISEAPAWKALDALQKISAKLAHCVFRRACGLPAIPEAAALAQWIESNAPRMSPVLDVDLRHAPSLVFDLSVGSPLLGADFRAAETTALTRTLFHEMEQANVSVGVGRYDEARLLYVSPLFGQGEAPTDERRTVHLGVDLFVEPGARVHAPLAGVVHILTNNNAPQDYGPLVVLRHQTDEGLAFFTLYGHLSDDTLTGCVEGQHVEAGQEIARVGTPPTNGDWAPHLHFQIILDLLDLGRDFPGVCRATERELWKEICPDPNLILGIPKERFGEPTRSVEDTLTRRRDVLPGNVGLSYERPLKIVRGLGSYLYDETGRAFLDMYNNVPLVGHTHPRVVCAAQAQLGLLNTNTRYLHDNVVRYAERLTALLPSSLSVCFFVNSGSEANDLALRLARTHTSRRDIVVLENAYHGHTQALIDVSPYKFDGPGGTGRPDFVHVAPMPDDYRGPYRRDDPAAGAKYGLKVGEVIRRMVEAGRPPSAFIAETLPSVGGQIVPPAGYLSEAYKHVRDAGALCIADEVQVGFGRLGTHFWGFEMQSVVPDIVVLGKPIGNGFPLAAVITTKEIAASFDNGMEFFSTFGGNPVACAAGLAVLDVLRDEGLQARAHEIGTRLLGSLRALQAKHALIGDVRGAGLFLGIELVLNRESREPAPLQAKYVVNRLRDLGVLTGTDGPHENVLKLRPPLVLSKSDADLFVETLDAVLAEDQAQP